MKNKIFITFSSSNIHVNITSSKDFTIFKQSCQVTKSSSGEAAFYKAMLIKVIAFINKHKLKSITVIISGFHAKRFIFLKDFFNNLQEISVTRIFFVSPKAFNGCRLKKARRLLFFILKKIGKWLSGLKS